MPCPHNATGWLTPKPYKQRFSLPAGKNPRRSRRGYRSEQRFVYVPPEAGSGYFARIYLRWKHGLREELGTVKAEASGDGGSIDLAFKQLTVRVIGSYTCDRQFIMDLARGKSTGKFHRRIVRRTDW